MPNRSTHLPVGGFSGMSIAAFLARNEPVECVLLEGIGGALGGSVGGLLPDGLEPATSPRHRKFCHSYAAAGGVALTASVVAEWQAQCRRWAAEQRAKALTFAPGSQERSAAELAAMGWSILSGFIAGVVVGYGSHLILDALTDQGLPILGLF